jgi:hypothetical protein
MFACTFLLGFVHDGNDPNATLYSCLGHYTMGTTATLNINDMVHRLEARGGQSAKSINHVSYWAGWYWKKHCREGSIVVLL